MGVRVEGAALPIFPVTLAPRETDESASEERDEAGEEGSARLLGASEGLLLAGFARLLLLVALLGGF